MTCIDTRTRFPCGALCAWTGFILGSAFSAGYQCSGRCCRLQADTLEEVRVGVGRDGDGTVSESFADHRHRDSRGEHEACLAMTKIVQANGTQPRCEGQFPETLRYGLGVQVRPVFACEDVVTLDPCVAPLPALLLLAEWWLSSAPTHWRDESTLPGVAGSDVTERPPGLTWTRQGPKGVTRAVVSGLEAIERLEGPYILVVGESDGPKCLRFVSACANAWAGPFIREGVCGGQIEGRRSSDLRGSRRGDRWKLRAVPGVGWHARP